MSFLLLLGLSACGGGGSGSATAPADTPPTANFAFACQDLVCNFTSTSTDQDVGDAIMTYNWTFGDASGAVTTVNTSHTFTAGNTYDVTLKVSDRAGVMSTVVRQVVVTAPPAAAAPHARFTVNCLSLDCTFTDTSTYDAGSVFQSRVWDFGDNVTLAAATPASHQYSVTTLSTLTVKLAVTDAAGKTSTSVQSIPVSPPATTLNCVGGGCVLNLAQASKVTATLVSHSCAAHGNEVVLTSPITQTIFADGCYEPIGGAIPINGGNTLAANTSLEVAVRSGLSGTTGLLLAPSIRVTGDFANGWTLAFDDGYGGPGEPDFNDLIILIKATP